MSAREAHVELLLGRRVHDADGHSLGWLEEIRAVHHDGELRVSQYLVGRSGVAARLTSVTLLHRVLHILLPSTHRSGYLIPWTWMDLSDPEHPRCTHRKAELQRIANEPLSHPPIDA